MNELLLTGLLACSATPDPMPLSVPVAQAATRYETRTERVCETDASGRQTCRTRQVVVAVAAPVASSIPARRAADCACADCQCGSAQRAGSEPAVYVTAGSGPLSRVGILGRSRAWFPGKLFQSIRSNRGRCE